MAHGYAHDCDAPFNSIPAAKDSGEDDALTNAEASAAGLAARNVGYEPFRDEAAPHHRDQREEPIVTYPTSAQIGQLATLQGMSTYARRPETNSSGS